MTVLWRESRRFPAPAKLNLMLRIVGRREDGYHLLQTVFQFIDYCDWLTFTPREDGAVRLLEPLPGVPEEADLTIRAAKSLKAFAGIQAGVTIHIEKNLPMGGGLGGGSSDAATTLLALNHLWGVGLAGAELKTLGLALGADVPVFIEGVAAWAEGVGEHLTPLELDEVWYVVIVPPCHVATGRIFNDPDLTRNNLPITIRDFFEGQKDNHCLPVVAMAYPEVAAALSALSRVGEARLTGTGACVFAAFDTEGLALEAAQRLGTAWRTLVVRGMNRSPLLAYLT
ncbi:MAG: 4-(cytidine 5'-diphospho)-2-C-methyl-D-erythritol kinase [Methylococcus sp.]|nr:MAG: 4-(cytidine 5'-diphospho)-2-C-methyl-D-erythritol kinase [Methylococcus sp.]